MPPLQDRAGQRGTNLLVTLINLRQIVYFSNEMYALLLVVLPPAPAEAAQSKLSEEKSVSY